MTNQNQLASQYCDQVAVVVVRAIMVDATDHESFLLHVMPLIQQNQIQRMVLACTVGFSQHCCTNLTHCRGNLNFDSDDDLILNLFAADSCNLFI
jgi:hypothetical protein